MLFPGEGEMINRVEVILPGLIVREGKRILEAHSTVTLVRARRGLILVDTSDRGWRQQLLDALDAADVDPTEVTTVVSTHLHHDHVGNNDLFGNARFLARREEAPGPEYASVQEDMDIDHGVHLIHLPGHTLGTMGVLVQAEHTYLIAGDALPTKENYDKWLPPGFHQDREAALRSMELLRDCADIIVPGHGGAFSIR
jgi:glyoxylase-like metal-dependent hydrolase (beta-lactamase superfamily II)